MNKTKKLADGQTHKILFSNGKLYLDGVQLAGEGISPPKDVMFEFKVNTEPEDEPVEQLKNPEFLEINVAEDMNMRDVGPGQK